MAEETTSAPRRGQQSYSPAELNRIVMEYLIKKGFHKTEAMFRMESTSTPTPRVPAPLPATSALAAPTELHRNGEVQALKEKAARAERELREAKDRELQLAKEKELRAYREEEEKRRDSDPDVYARAYALLRGWVDSSLDLYKPELARLMYPLFVHCYLELVLRLHTAQAKVFFDRFAEEHRVLHGAELQQLAGLSLAEHLDENKLAQAYRSSRYRVVVLKTTMNLLLYFLHENDAVGGAVLIRIINQYLTPEMLSARPDSANQEGAAHAQEGIPGHTTEGIDLFNEQPVLLGKMPLDPEMEKEVQTELRVKDEQGVRTELTTLLEEFSEMAKTELDLPAAGLLPLPMPDASDVKRTILAVEDLRQRLRLGTVQALAPSVCMYTFHNTHHDMTTVAFNDDLTTVAAGFQDSFVRLWLLDGRPLRLAMKRDPHNGDSTRRLVGHAGAVYGLLFSPDNRYLLLALEDRTARLWLLDTYTALVLYKGHNQPVWDVQFLPLGHYFATALHDHTARLWATDHIYPLRIFAGHINDVDCVQFHPNLSYVFTGSADKTCRMWDVHLGAAVRVFVGHTAPVTCLAVLPDGRWLASAGEDAVINVWDCGSGRRLKLMRGHGRLLIYSLAFSRDGAVLVSGAADNLVRVWDARRSTADAGPEPEPFGEQERGRREIVATPDHITAYFTKKTPVYKVHFSRRNLCLAAGLLGS